jgi:hypothetical protein
MKTELSILKSRGYKPNSDLNFCLANGCEYYVGYSKDRAAIVALMPENESIYFLDKVDLRTMAETAKTYNINTVDLFTNYGIELHSKHEKPEIVGLTRVIKIDKEGFAHK